MTGGHSEREIRSHIVLTAKRSQDDLNVLAEALHRRSWPAGSDRVDPRALGLLRRERPSRAKLLPQLCGCASGRCLVCN